MFSPAEPSVAVSSPNVSESGLQASGASLREVSPSGSTVAVANFSGANWTRSDESTDDVYDMAYSASVVVTNPSTSTVLGSTSIELQYLLPAYADAGNANAVTIQLAMEHWPWQSANDVIALESALAPAYPSTERLTIPNGTTDQVVSAARTNGAARETLTVGTAATVTNAEGASVNISVTPSITVAPSTGTYVATFASSAGEFQSLAYGTTISVPVPATIAGIPVIDFVVVGVAAAAIASLVGAGTIVIRRPEDDLTYVDDEPPASGAGSAPPKTAIRFADRIVLFRKRSGVDSSRGPRSPP
jgi:hypothetical protein